MHQIEGSTFSYATPLLQHQAQLWLNPARLQCPCDTEIQVAALGSCMIYLQILLYDINNNYNVLAKLFFPDHIDQKSGLFQQQL